MKEELHVTLWHCEDQTMGANLELQRTLLDALGSEVAFEITHVDYVPRGMAAAKVQVSRTKI